jgi:hypothetical protein
LRPWGAASEQSSGMRPWTRSPTRPRKRDLVNAFASLSTAIVTIEAMYTQHDTGMSSR